MKTSVRVLLVGLGGYGMYYVNYFLDRQRHDLPCSLCAGVDPVPASCSRLQELQERGIPIYDGLDQALQQQQPNLVIISTPIHTHLTLSEQAMAFGANVLLEKPLAGNLAQAETLLALSERHPGFLTIGYQSSFSPVTAVFLADLKAGVFGDLQSLKTLALRPRDEQYFQRSSWAGACFTAQGDPVFDGPAMNANAHSLFFQLMVSDLCRPGPMDLHSCSLLRTNAIENHDSIACAFTIGGVPHLFFASHSVRGSDTVEFCYTFADAQVYLNQDRCLEAQFTDGTVKTYGSIAGKDEKIEACIAAILNGTTPICNLLAAKRHIELIDRIQQSPIEQVPQERVYCTGDLLWVAGLSELYQTAYDAGRMPDMTGVLSVNNVVD